MNIKQAIRRGAEEAVQQIFRFGFWFLYLLLETLILLWCWPSLAWLFKQLFQRTLSVPSFATLFGILFFWSVFVNNSLMDMAADEADKDRALRMMSLPNSDEGSTIIDREIHQIGGSDHDA